MYQLICMDTGKILFEGKYELCALIWKNYTQAMQEGTGIVDTLTDKFVSIV